MVKTLPARFNPDLMTRNGTRHEVTVPIRQFPRLADILASAAGEVRATALFSRRKDHIVVAGRLVASWPLECQRCLEPMMVDIDEPYELVFVENETAARELPKELDPVVLDENGQIHLVELFEDELMLHVPTIPKHADRALCGSVAERLTDTDEAADEVAEQRPNPFAVLKNLNIH